MPETNSGLDLYSIVIAADKRYTQASCFSSPALESAKAERNLGQSNAIG
jgi:hypothetical protein